jgi:hypothetical protein
MYTISQPNVWATVALAGFPLIILGFFLMMRPPSAVALSLLLAEMFLPPYYLLPMTPSFLGKWTIPGFTFGLLMPIFGKSYLRGSKPFRGIEVLFLLGLFGSFMTWRTNMDPLQYGPTTVPAHALPDFLGEAILLIADPWIIFFLGRVLFRSSRDLRTLCKLFIVCCLIYSLPVLYEIKMSPSLNVKLYGYLAGGWETVFRWGGYRPLVFFPDGLHLTSFMLACTLIAISTARVGWRTGSLPATPVALYLIAVLIACKSTGAILYLFLLLPILVMGSPRWMLRIAKVLAVVFIAYPFVRINNLMPTNAISDLFKGLSADRADSLQFRFDMEQGMLDLTRHRAFFGWGGWGRNFVYDPNTGRCTSVVDGAVIICLSSHGLFGFITYYMPYALTVIRSTRFIKRIQSRQDKLVLSALALNCAVILIDLVVNSAFFPVFMLMFGALYGLSEGIVAEERAAAEAEEELPAEWDGDREAAGAYS